MLSQSRVFVVLTLFGLTLFAIRNTDGVTRIPITSPLDGFPKNIREYQLAETFQSSAGVVELLGVDDYINYYYIRPDGRGIGLYVGFYEVVGVDGGYHSPRNCIPGGGWGIDETSSVGLNSGIEGKKTSKISEMVIRRGDEYQMVFFWYQNRGRIIASEYAEKFYQVTDALLKGRRDGTFVRIMATIPKSEDFTQTRDEMKGFAEQVMVTLEEYLPGISI